MVLLEVGCALFGVGSVAIVYVWLRLRRRAAMSSAYVEQSRPVPCPPVVYDVGRASSASE